MKKGAVSFRERNRARLAKKRRPDSKLKAGEGGCYEEGGRSKFGDFVIGFVIIFLPFFVSPIFGILAIILSCVFYNKYFAGRRYVKIGMWSAGIFYGAIYLLLLLGVLYFVFY